MSQIDGFYQQPHFNVSIQPQQQQGIYGSSSGSEASQQHQGFSQNRFQHQQQQQQQQHKQYYQPLQSPGPNVSHGAHSAASMMQQAGFSHQGASLPPHQSNAYATVGFPQSVTASSSTPRHQGLAHAPSPSPFNFPSPTAQIMNQLPGQSAQNLAMAAPPTPQAAQTQLQSPRSSLNSHSQPPSPGQAVPPGREKERITLLLEINVELLQEIHNLQAQGKGGAQSAAQAEAFRSKGLPDAIASQDYIQILCRLHANLGYLCAQSDLQKPGSKVPHPPSFMKAPPNMPVLEEKYTELRRLFPGWVGRDGPAADQSTGGQMSGVGMSG